MIGMLNPVTMHETVSNAVQLTGNGSAIDIDGAHDIYIVAEINKGNGAALTLTPQRTDAIASGWVGLANNMRIWASADTANSDTLVRDTNGLLYTSGAVATTHRVILKIDPDSLGLDPVSDDPITQIRVVVAGGNANDRGSITAYLVPRYR